MLRVNKLIICQDGTWNQPENKYPTNVEKIKEMLINDNVQQSVKYQKGIGTHGRIDKALGGTTGWGISRDILSAYETIVEHYKVGTDIYLFGFSRGAYTVRSLSGFLHLVGVLKEDARELYKEKYNADLLVDAYNYYRLPITESQSWTTRQIQKRYFGATSRADYVKNGRPFSEILDDAKIKESKRLIAWDDGEKEVNFESIRVEFLGVWDTVGSLGAPGLTGITKPWVSFHDTSVSENVVCAYQALALHELRENFVPDIWTKKHPNNQTVEQCWFAGAHSNVGGGYQNQELSNISLRWMINNATNRKNGLAFKVKDCRYRNLMQQADSFSESVDISCSGHWKLLGRCIRNIEVDGNITQDVRDWIYTHDSVRSRLAFSKDRYHNRYDEEPLFESVDSLSMKLPTRDEAIEKIKRRKCKNDIRNLIKNNDDGVDIEEVENGVIIGGIFLECKDELEKTDLKSSNKKSG